MIFAIVLGVIVGVIFTLSFFLRKQNKIEKNSIDMIRKQGLKYRNNGKEVDFIKQIDRELKINKPVIPVKQGLFKRYALGVRGLIIPKRK